MSEMLGNEEAMAEIRRTMEIAELQKRNAQGGKLKEGTYIDYTSEEGNSYKGFVLFKKPTMQDIMKMGAIKSEIFRRSGVQNIELVDPDIDFMARVMSTLAVVLVKKPEWLLKIEEIKEADVLYHVFGKFEDWERSFRKPILSADTGDSEGSDRAEAVDASEARVRGDSADRPEGSGDDEGAD